MALKKQSCDVDLGKVCAPPDCSALKAPASACPDVKAELLPVPTGVVEAISGYLASRGLPGGVGAANPKAHVLGHSSDVAERAPGPVRGRAAASAGAGIAATTLHDQVKAFFAAYAKELRGRGDEKGAARLAQDSTHWLRHTHASHAIANGMAIEIASKTSATRRWPPRPSASRPEEKCRMKAVKKFWEGRAGR